DLVVMEGTGSGGGIPLLLARLLWGVRYVVSSGDAVSPFLSARRPWLRPAFAMYERALCRWCAGYVGWTPYLAGRALTFGAARAMSAPGWSSFSLDEQQRAAARSAIRASLGIRDDEIVFG